MAFPVPSPESFISAERRAELQNGVMERLEFAFGPKSSWPEDSYLTALRDAIQPEEGGNAQQAVFFSRIQRGIREGFQQFCDFEADEWAAGSYPDYGTWENFCKNVVGYPLHDAATGEYGLRYSNELDEEGYPLVKWGSQDSVHNGVAQSGHYVVVGDSGGSTLEEDIIACLDKMRAIYREGLPPVAASKGESNYLVAEGDSFVKYIKNEDGTYEWHGEAWDAQYLNAIATAESTKVIEPTEVVGGAYNYLELNNTGEHIVCDTCDESDICGTCNTCNLDDFYCPTCDVVDTCVSDDCATCNLDDFYCPTCDLYDECATCNYADGECPTCDDSDMCATCNLDDLIWNGDPECPSETVCGTCETGDACATCDYDDFVCYVCDTYDACATCDLSDIDCQTCDSEDDCSCDTCNTCNNEDQQCTTCDESDTCPGSDICSTCNNEDSIRSDYARVEQRVGYSYPSYSAQYPFESGGRVAFRYAVMASGGNFNDYGTGYEESSLPYSWIPCGTAAIPGSGPAYGDKLGINPELLEWLDPGLEEYYFGYIDGFYIVFDGVLVEGNFSN